MINFKMIISIFFAVLILSGCSFGKESEDDIKENILEKMDLYAAILNEQESCGKLAYVNSKSKVDIDFSSVSGFFSSIEFKITPRFLFTKFIGDNCEDIFRGTNVLDIDDFSYEVKKFELDTQDGDEIAKLYVHINALDKGIPFTRNKVYYFDKSLTNGWVMFHYENY